MIKKTVPYTDYNGVSKTHTAYFHMNKLELTKFSAPFSGSPEKLKDYIAKISAKDDLTELIDFVEKIILDSYGIKSEDGSKFVKSKEAREEYASSEAYAELFDLLMRNENEAQNFFVSIVGNAQAGPNIQPIQTPVGQPVQSIDGIIQQGQPAQSTPIHTIQQAQDQSVIPGSPSWSPVQ